MAYKMDTILSKQKILKSTPFKPWIIKHVEQQLEERYSVDLPSILKLLCTSPLEKQFYEFWLSKYYPNKDNPSIIPEVSGFRAQFYYYECYKKFYSMRSEIPEDAKIFRYKTKKLQI